MAVAPARVRPNNLPAELTSFVGRRRELSEVKRLLTQTRLLTLTGSGGAGKTRLALRAAAEMARSFRDGVWLVPLASIDDPQLVVQAVFSALGLQDVSSEMSLMTLSRYLADKHLLLVLDNCEHLLDSCAVLAVHLLKSCQDLRVLATSRQALTVTGETRLRVPPLSLPKVGELPPPERLATYEAVALLSERAAAVHPTFAVDQANAGAVLRLCRHLDGMPLALELAAVRLEGLTVEQVASSLEGGFAALSTGTRGAETRQQTLNATIGWSYGLLEEQERLLWARLSVFAGGFDLEAAIEVCFDARVPSDRIAGLLGALVEKSILKREPGIDPARYGLLETLRQYGRQRLHELSADELETLTRHRDWVLTLAMEVGAWNHRQAEAFNRIHAERDNLWAALDFCLRQPGQASKGAEICRHLWTYWISRGPCGDARRVVMSLLELTPKNSLGRVRLLLAAAALAAAQNDYGACETLSEEGGRLAHQVGDGEVVGWFLIWRGLARWVHGETTAALELAESAISLGRVMQTKPVLLNAMGLVCNIRFATGDLDGAFEAGEEAVALSQELGEIWQRGYILNFLFQASFQRGDFRRSDEESRESIACKHALDDRQGLSIVLETLAWMAAERGAYDRAATLQGCAEQLRLTAGTALQEHFRAQHDSAASTAARALGASAFSAAVDRGRAMTIDEAIAYALDLQRPKLASAVTVVTKTPLTRRELEIARLIADGLTSQQIAAKLFISERTVTTHVTNMLNKLGLSSRIQLASWVAGPHQRN